LLPDLNLGAVMTTKFLKHSFGAFLAFYFFAAPIGFGSGEDKNASVEKMAPATLKYSEEEKATYLWLNEKFMSKIKTQSDFQLLESEISKPLYKECLFVYTFAILPDGLVCNLRRYGRQPQHTRAEKLIEVLLERAAPFAPPPNKLTSTRGLALDFRYDGELITSVRLLQPFENQQRPD
jgi:hypothetical protein